MKESRRARRMEMHHKRRMDRAASLNMVSLMDIFTILVFFLLVSAVNTEVLPSPKAIKLPESTAEKLPKENVIIMVDDKFVLMQGKRVADVSKVLRSQQAIIPQLMTELVSYASKKKTKKGVVPVTKRGVTIMGDKSIPYKLLKKIMLTCASADYTNISLAVVKKNAGKKRS